ncbi:MAG: aminoacetone oxidase family FAD-binding enzyme [Planctomycetota bacterium]|nr:MAG: aminoacetone oxidase family FAD-binding enzyme [Planctomycetota bacterium]
MTTVAIIGAGAAGMFAAIQAAQAGAQVVVLESGRTPLAKVAIAGGGRCNVTHDCIDPVAFASAYPRGGRELRAAFAHFQARDCMQWFSRVGVALKTEPDGRVFPTSDDSATICDAIRREARSAGVVLRTQHRVRALSRLDHTYHIRLDHQEISADRVLLASGGARQGMALAEGLGHTIHDPVPALFTVRCRDPLLKDLAGIASTARVTVQAQDITREHCAEGPLLITHWGLSGPALLKASSWAARDLAQAGWKGTLTVDWCPEHHEHAVRQQLRDLRSQHPRKQVASLTFAGIPRRLWERLLARAGMSGAWATQSNGAIEGLVQTLRQCKLAITDKGPFREEFVVCGGVARKEIDWRRMESRLLPGLHVAGEALDQDGLTGGFNLQAAWTTGWIAGRAMAAPLG